MEERRSNNNNNRFAGKKAIGVIASLLAATLSATVILVLQEQSAVAQSSNNSSNNNSSNTTISSLPQLQGSVGIQNATNDFVKNNVKVSFTDAANTAKSQVTNGVVVGGGLSDVQGYLTYTFRVANYNAGTIKIVIVDAGNGKVLYTSNDLTLYNGGIGGGGGCIAGGHTGRGGW